VWRVVGNTRFCSRSEWSTKCTGTASALCLLPAAVLPIGCSRKVDSLVLTKANRKYALTRILYREKLDLSNGSADLLVNRVTIRDDRTGAEVPFSPENPESLSMSSGYYTDVWSPDEEILVLPLGRFHGFRIFRATDAIRRLKEGASDDFIRVQLRTGTRLWHAFKGWQGAHALVFTTGLSGTEDEYTYVPFTRMLDGPDLPEGFIGLNAQGEIPIRRAGRR